MPSATCVRLMPRLKRIKYERLYLSEKGIAADYPNLAGIFARAIRWDHIEQQYDVWSRRPWPSSAARRQQKRF